MKLAFALLLLAASLQGQTIGQETRNKSGWWLYEGAVIEGGLPVRTRKPPRIALVEPERPDLTWPTCDTNESVAYQGGANGTGRYVCVPPPEPVYVPAIQVGEHMGFACGREELCFESLMPKYTCTDKLRILEHDQATPAHWWCRKVQ
jgi:hypothetical protein